MKKLASREALSSWSEPDHCLSRAASFWAELASPPDFVRLSPQIVERARQPFPGEPIHTLDALHVASALYMRAVLPDLAVLSFDDRIRRVARGLGLPLLPS